MTISREPERSPAPAPNVDPPAHQQEEEQGRHQHVIGGENCI